MSKHTFRDLKYFFLALASISLVCIPVSTIAKIIEFPEINCMITVEPEYGYTLDSYTSKRIKVTIESLNINNIKGPGEIAISIPNNSGLSINNNSLDINVHKLLPGGGYDIRGYDEIREFLLVSSFIVSKQPWSTVGNMLPWGGDILSGVLIYLANNSISLTKGFSFVVNDIIGVWQTRELSYGSSPSGNAWNDIQKFEMTSFGYDLGPMIGGWAAKKIETYIEIDVNKPKINIPISVYGYFTWWDGLYTLNKCGFQYDFILNPKSMPWLSLLLDSTPNPPPTVDCGAYVAPGVWKEFDCYNLAAIGKTTNDDPFTPSWRLNGGYWQWGRKGPDPNQWYDNNTPNFSHGPTGSGSAEANSDAISGWDTTTAPDGSWSDAYKTPNDPCPPGYRVPTISQWQGVNENNDQSIVGSWANSATNYGTARFFGDYLMLPAAGYRNYQNYPGRLFFRGYWGSYWSSTEYSSGSDEAWRLGVYSSGASTYSYNRRSYGSSVRCVAE